MIEKYRINIINTKKLVSIVGVKVLIKYTYSSTNKDKALANFIKALALKSYIKGAYGEITKNIG